MLATSLRHKGLAEKRGNRRRPAKPEQAGNVGMVREAMSRIIPGRCSQGVLAVPNSGRYYGAMNMRSPRPVEIVGDIAMVTLTKDHVAIIDAADVGLVAGRNWHALTGSRREARRNVYAARSEIVGGRSRCILLHRLLTDCPEGFDVDHIDGDGLNCRRSNLRICTHQENVRNSRRSRRNKTDAKGVSRRGDRFTACIETDGRSIYLGIYDTQAEAAAAYQGAASVLFGEFARVA